MVIIDKNELNNAIDIARADLQKECLLNNQHDDIVPFQEMAAILPIILKHAYSKRMIAKGKKHDQLIGELTDYVKTEALSDKTPYTDEDIRQVLTTLLKCL